MQFSWTDIDEIAFDQVFAFIYSPRPFTQAAQLEDGVPIGEKEERLQRLFERQAAITRTRNQALVGSVVDVLIEGPAKSASPRQPSLYLDRDMQGVAEHPVEYTDPG